MSVWTLQTGQRGVDATEVRRALLALVDPEYGVQIQALPSGRWEIHPGGDLDALCAAAERLSDERGVYFALNPCPIGRTTPINREAMLCRRWMLLDCDPIRPKDTNSTEAEHDLAGTAVLAAMDGLTARGWPAPLVVDSGNGWHLLYRVDLPNDELARALVKGCIHAVADLFPTDGVEWDRSVHNANRISKLPGTWARKGPHSADRPHRLARLVVLPETVTPVPVELLRALADGPSSGRSEDGPPSSSTQPPRAQPFRVRAAGEPEKAYARAAIRYECDRLKVTPVGKRNETLNRVAFVAGTFLHVLQRQEVETELELAAHAAGLLADEPEKTRDTLRRALDAGAAADPRVIPSPKVGVNGAGYTGPATPPVDPGDLWSVVMGGEVVAEGTPDELALEYRLKPREGRKVFEMVTLEELMQRDLPDPNWVVPGLLAEGLNLLAGAPKQGKSMMALNLALTVAAGGKALGNIQVQPGDVLYLSLEDRQRRVQFRARKMAAKIPGSGRRLTVVTDWPRMDQGGLGLLAEWVKRVERPVLIIVDVLQRFRPRLRDRGSAYEQDSDHLYAVKQFADEYGVTVLVLHHTRKMKDDDPLATISGTFGLTGACDGYAVLDRVRQSNEATCFFEGRDAGNQKLALRFDPDSLVWESLGSADEVLNGRLQQKVLAYLKGRAGQPVFARDVADHLNEDTTDKVRPILHKLLSKGLIQRRGSAWSYPGQGEEVVDDVDEEAV